MNIRNVAIIAHVDHGKTTLVDAMLRQSHTKISKETLEKGDLIMDSNDLERERGITIFSKNASINYKGTNGGSATGGGFTTKINIIDTPGHADFGGEVERVLKMADGALLLIDAKEGPMPQTKFVLKKALELGHKVIVVINKIDKPDARIEYVINKTFDLFIELGADEQTSYFPTIYASGKQGKAGLAADLSKMSDISPVFDAILKYIPAPVAEDDKPLQILITNTNYDNFKGRIATGRVYAGVVKAGQDVTHINREGVIKKFKLTSLLGFEGLDRVDIKEAHAGDIIALSGIPDITIGETIADPSSPVALPLIDIEPSTVRMRFGVNNSPLAGREGEFKTARQIQERLLKAQEADVALKLEPVGAEWIVSGRGELHLAILIERLRREGYEFQVGKPQVIEKMENGKTLTPYEKLALEVPEEFQGSVMQKMGLRHGELLDMTTENGVVYMEFIIATKELFGYRSQFITDTKGLGMISSSFLEYKQSLPSKDGRADSGGSFKRSNGSLVVHESGSTKLYTLVGAQDRGELFVGPGVEVYKGQVIGQNSREDDIWINVCKEKQQTNHRSSGEGTSAHFNSPKLMSLENAIEYIDDTEVVEVTPKNIRIRKIDLNG